VDESGSGTVGHVQDLWYRIVKDPTTGVTRRERTRLYGKGQRYRARYTGPGGQERSKSFPDRQKRQAEQFLATIEHSINTGRYVDRKAGEVTFREYAEAWLASQTFDEVSRETIEKRLKNQGYPYLGERSLASLTPTDIRTWHRQLQEAGLGASYRRTLLIHAQTILDNAVDDGKIGTNPCKSRSVRKPHVARRKVTPWSRERVDAVRNELPERFRVAVALGAGLGLRYGEAAGLAVEDIDFELGVVRVRRGIKALRGGECFGPPKNGKAREVPLPGTVADAVREHLAAYPPAEVTLPWQSRSGPPITANLVLHGVAGRPLRRSTFEHAWRRAVKRATGQAGPRGDGFHALRHHYASTLLDAGEPIVALAEYLGHADPGFTLRTYTHLMPKSRERAREIIDGGRGRVPAADGVTTA
jgi:integrase